MHCCAGPRADEVCALSALPMRARPLQFNLALAIGGADDEDEATALLEAAAQQGHGGAIRFSMCNMGVRTIGAGDSASELRLRRVRGGGAGARRPDSVGLFRRHGRGRGWAREHPPTC